jgi:hypothetical protein
MIRSLTRQFVKEGWWWYRKYAPRSKVLEKLETDAREVEARLWRDPNPLPS